MEELNDRIEAIEYVLGWLLARVAPDEIETALERHLPEAQYRLTPTENPALPHFERILALARRHLTDQSSP